MPTVLSVISIVIRSEAVSSKVNRSKVVTNKVIRSVVVVSFSHPVAQTEFPNSLPVGPRKSALLLPCYTTILTLNACVMGLVVWNKSSLLPKILFQNTQTLQLFTEIIKTEIIYQSNKMSSLKAWVKRPSGLIKTGR
jgi:hypothetical protein